ncbi:cytochrome b5 [Deferribacter thermophilus]|uniref:DUF2231 domain-containing protein n=1 Tax=Deferribacter thermophilus TaxID=53573 RepID=UPI003C21A31F
MKRDEVKKFDGKNGNRAYIIYKDKVYDVTDSKFWKNGIHMSRHKAGEDLTDFISMAPHGDDVLERDNIKFVDVLEPESINDKEDKKELLRKLYSKLHPHPIFVHFPMGIFYFGALMQLLYLLTKNSTFEKSGFYALIVATISIFPTVTSGILSWWINYDLTLTKIFKNKIVYSVILTVLSILLIFIKLQSSSIIIYTVGYFLLIPILTFIAYNGGKITWPN